MTKFLCGECIHNSDKGGGCLIPKNLGYVDNCNRYLPKDRPIVQTNEEWLHTLTTEQLADKLTDFFFWLVPTIPTEDKREQIRKKIENWLKEKHDESV